MRHAQQSLGKSGSEGECGGLPIRNRRYYSPFHLVHGGVRFARPPFLFSRAPALFRIRLGLWGVPRVGRSRKNALQHSLTAPVCFIGCVFFVRLFGWHTENHIMTHLTGTLLSMPAADEFYCMIGQCIAEWAKVDDELFGIFRDCVGPYDQCAIIYYRIPGLDARFGLTDEIVRSVLPKTESGEQPHPRLKAWTKAIKGYQNLLGVRRRIAHQPVDMKMDLRGRPSGMNQMIGNFQFNALAFAPARSWFEIYVNQHEGLRSKESDSKPLLLSDLKKHLLDVNSLFGHLMIFYHEVLTKQQE
jgi:hypothetical protein